MLLCIALCVCCVCGSETWQRRKAGDMSRHNEDRLPHCSQQVCRVDQLPSSPLSLSPLSPPCCWWSPIYYVAYTQSFTFLRLTAAAARQSGFIPVCHLPAVLFNRSFSSAYVERCFRKNLGYFPKFFSNALFNFDASFES